MILEYKFALRSDLTEEKMFLPTKATPEDSGYDVRCALVDKKSLVVKPFEYVKIPLGIRGFCPAGYWYELNPRSSTFAKKQLHALYGKIDCTFEGELMFAAQYIPAYISSDLKEKFNSHEAEWFNYMTSNELTINYGDAIGQIIPVKRLDMTVVELTNEQYDEECKNRGAKRGAGGFGSSSS